MTLYRSHGQVTTGIKIPGNLLLPYWSYFMFSFLSPVFLLLFTFQSPQLIAFVLFYFVCCSECLVVIRGRDRMQYTSSIWLEPEVQQHTWNPFLLVGAPLSLTSRSPLIEHVSRNLIFPGLVLPGPRTLWLQVCCLICIDLWYKCSLSNNILHAPMCFILGIQKWLKHGPCPQGAHSPLQ